VGPGIQSYTVCIPVMVNAKKIGVGGELVI
jgi:hypothetical protein